jgi:hypothetical protein
MNTAYAIEESQMPSKSLASLIAYLQRFPEEREELESLRLHGESLIQWAKTNGCDIENEEAERLFENLHQLSDDDLDQVAGGDDAWGGGTTTGGTGSTTGGSGTGTP